MLPRRIKTFTSSGKLYLAASVIISRTSDFLKICLQHFLKHRFVVWMNIPTHLESNVLSYTRSMVSNIVSMLFCSRLKFAKPTRRSEIRQSPKPSQFSFAPRIDSLKGIGSKMIFVLHSTDSQRRRHNDPILVLTLKMWSRNAFLSQALQHFFLSIMPLSYLFIFLVLRFVSCFVLMFFFLLIFANWMQIMCSQNRLP